MINLAWSFIKPFLLPIAVVGAILGVFFFYGHSRYTAGYSKAEAKYQIVVEELTRKTKEAREAHQRDLENWTQIVKTWEAQIEEIKKQRDAAVKKGTTVYRDRVRTIIKEKESAPKVEFKPDDVVVAPAGFRMLHDHAASGSYAATGQFLGPFPPNPARVAGQTETFEAYGFTEVVVGNYHQYNQLAAQCDALISVIEDFMKAEKPNDPNARGTKGAPSGTR